MRKPRVFIGSAREAIHYVNEIHSQLHYVAEVTPWSAGAFKPNNYPMEDLEAQVDSNDFAVFVFSPDDLVIMRGKTYLQPRDNTIFEMGLFWGKLRRRRVFYIIPNTVTREVGEFTVEDFHIPSDLAGLTVLTYEIRDDGNYTAAVNVSCHAIKTAIAKEGLFIDPEHHLIEKQREIESKNMLLEFFTEFIDRHMLEDRYDKLYNAIRNSYNLNVLPGFKIRGGAVWKAEGSEGIRYVAGSVGKDRFFPFSANDSKSDGEERIMVVDCYLESTVKFHYAGRAAFASEYILCYPLGTEIVVTLHIRGQKEVSQEEFAVLDEENQELLTTLNYLFGGD
ncbi:TIR domain-containing protein [Paenibacillus sp. Dod16]|uniref:TIR domain-containing protein n=1 Tax=Paenibacillus sp. Dod16 TaxID=3416392 RepID=UPI003CEA0762